MWSPRTQVIFSLAVLLLVALQSSSAQPCPVSGCTGCGNSTVDCSYAGLTTFPQLPIDVQQVTEELYLRHNSLTSLDVTVLENFTNLTVLDLHTNNLEDLPNNLFAANTKLRVLDLSRNNLMELSENLFAANTELQTLDLSLNSLTRLPGNIFAANTDLQTLELVDNNITEVPQELFLENTQLKYISLSGNLLTEIPTSLFVSNEQLETIMMNSNLLTELPADVFTSNGALRIIGVCCNLLTGLTEGIFDANTLLNYVSLGSNRVQCDCNLRWLPSFLESRDSALLINGNCVNLDGASISSLSEDQLVCECVPVCEDGNCNLTTGLCENGTNSVSAGCTPGTWGAGCLQNCTCVTEHQSSPCDILDGTCHCLPEYTGVDCEQESTPSSEGSSQILIGSVAGGTCAVALIVLLAIVLAALLVCKRRHHQKSDTSLVLESTVATEVKTAVIDVTTVDPKPKEGMDEQDRSPQYSTVPSTGLVIARDPTPSAQDIIARLEGLEYHDDSPKHNSNITAFERVHAEAILLYGSDHGPKSLTNAHDDTAESQYCTIEHDTLPFMTAASVLEGFQAELEHIYDLPLELFEQKEPPPKQSVPTADRAKDHSTGPVEAGDLTATHKQEITTSKATV